ncbi:aminopeptidase [Chryseobacterium sp. T16E-39]|uniref:ABC transporter permease/M1 family aminopeptidase n=1 Tax=Chryseobacterium sp. T16E-39 TaxID=2015076 RepID=UPI000B5B2A1F|nr:M1 family aminopeptidase [Chryseobacterium sp. T16E-39]ASK32382.1 aminopeptidase [Chryseobacterium sp. T16E-39]
MNTLFLFEAKRTIKHWLSYLIGLILVFLGIFCGNQFNLSVGEGIYLNSPYSIGFMVAMLSLSILFFAIIYASQQLFKDWDSKFDSILFSFPFSKWNYLKGRFTSYFLQTFISFLLLISGFIIGQNLRTGSEIQHSFNLWHYIYPLLIFGFINCLLVCSFLFLISYSTKRKLLVVIGGLLLYVLYMVVLLFSNSPFMAGSLPQSAEAQQWSALLDPFGISAYFFEARSSSIQQKNQLIVPPLGYLLINRLVYVILSGMLLFLSYYLFSFTAHSDKKSKKRNELFPPVISTPTDYHIAQSDFGYKTSFKSILSFAKIDLIYLFKSITIIAICILLLFAVGMEMYAEIEKGIRLPQKYAGSGLMASTISENFHLLGLLIMTYFINDLYWRSQSSGFYLIEKSTYFAKNKLIGHLLSSGILLFFFTGILIIEGLIFQLGYHYFHIDWNAYSGVILFNTLPIFLFSAFLLLINDLIKNRFVALGISVLAVFMLAGPASHKLISHPLFRIFSDLKGVYSDFSGYGIYVTAFSERLLFGMGLIILLWMINEWGKTKKWSLKKLIFSTVILVSGIFAGYQFTKGYIAKDEEKMMATAAEYEKKFKFYEMLPQPTITDVITQVNLSPSTHSYTIEGKYILTNNTNTTIDKILINFDPNLKIQSAIFSTPFESEKINTKVHEVHLKHSLQPNATATLSFTLFYQWHAVNGHESFNAIIQNGSFMRISRYYPSIGYQKNYEVEDEKRRMDFKLGKASKIKRLEAPEVSQKDFINLDMTISTDKDQTAIGTGDLIKQWTKNNRTYFQYKVSQIPFRFAVSSAKYSQKSINYKGVTINLFYHQKHSENVDHLLNNAKITLDYCTQNFGKYPFKTITFAEISSFTKGFAATAYPSAIFMPEDMVFHSNIHADKEQDVINELAGHELSHLWWGNSQIDPDDREGSVMLTETLAMYTEMMLYKKMHGKLKMMDRIKMHQQIYDNEKGLSENEPIYKVTGDNPHIAYSKGAVAMVQLSNLLGEEKVNTALRNFLLHNQYPKKPTSLDLLLEFYKICPNDSAKKEVDRLFKKI